MLLSTWNGTYPLILANELTGDRAWLGDLYLVAVYSRALEATEVERNYKAGIGQIIQADFEADRQWGATPLEVTFTANPSGQVLTYTWDFGDGSAPHVTLVPTATYTYPTAGVFSVTLTVEGPAGSHSLTRPAYIVAYADLSLSRAFAFGADTWTRATANEPGVDYTKVQQSGQNFSYTVSQTHGYIDTSGLDTTPNNRGVYTGTDELYDQFIGATNSGSISFRIDVPNGRYRFVAAGGDAHYSGHATTIAVQDGNSGQVLTLVENYLAAAPGEFWTVTFDDKAVPPADGVGADPVFLSQPDSGILEVTQGYVQVIQQVGNGATNGGDLSLLEMWRLEETPVQADFSAFPLSGTAPLTVTFNNGSTHATSYLWDFGDGVTSTSISPTHTYTQTGVYTVTLSASDGTLTDTLTYTSYIAVYEPVVADFGASPLTGTAPLTVTFVNSSTGATDYLWTFGTGASLTVEDPSYIYAQAGVYTVSLKASGPGGSDILTKTSYITVTSPLSLAFAATPVTGTVPLTVTFVNSSSGASTYLWGYGDGSTNTTSAITHTHLYTQSGVYTVSLTASGPGGSDTLTRTHYITVTAPSAGARVTEGLQVLYTFEEGSGTTVADVSGVGSPLDLTIGDEANVGWLPGGGVVISSSTVISSGGSATKLNNALPTSEEITLEAWLKPANTTQAGPARIIALSIDPDPTGGNFILGQGDNSGGQAAVYSTRLRTTATNQYGLPSIQSPNDSLTTDLTHVLYTRSISGETKLYLDGVLVADDSVGGDFSTWTSSAVLALANEPTGNRPWLGELHLVAVYDRALSAAEVSQNYMAGPHGPLPPVVDFMAAPLTGTAPLTVTFVNSSTGASTYLWDFGDDTTSTVISPTHTYTQPGVYTVTLAASNGTLTDTLTYTSYIVVSETNTRVTQDLQALYTFTEGISTTIHDVSNVGTPLDLAMADTGYSGWVPGGGIYINAATSISSTGAATKIIDAAQAGGEITLEAWLNPRNVSQTGPANIVSLSADTNNRNVTLGQLAEQYDVRLRTTATDSNGEPSLTTAGGVLTNTLTHLVYTRDAGGTARLYLDAVEVVSDTVSGNFSNWDDDYRLLLANELTGDRPWTGELYLVAFYSRALSQAEVSRNFSVKPETGPPVVLTTEVISSTGGVITSTDGLVTLDFAPNAVTETLNIEIIQQQMSQTVITATAAYSAALLPPPDGLPFKIIDLTARRSGEDEVLEVQFQAPVTLTYHYSITEVNLIPEDSLQFFYYNLAAERLDPLPTTVQTETLQMSSVITHFSPHGVGGDSMVSIAPTIDAFEVALSRGSASYSYDIPLPAGPNGFGPKLTLQYNSGLVNSLYEPKPARGGWVGTGWTLELGEITDVGNYYLDTDNPVQRLKMSYGLTLNGLSEQIKVTKTDGVLSYGTEHQTFMVIEKISEPPWVDRHGWILTDTEGTTYYFGNDGNSGSRITHYGGTQQHGCYPTQEIDKLYKVVDRHGNTMEIDYYQPTTHFQCGGEWREEVTQSYIEEIRYTTNGSDDHREYVVKFQVEDINGYKLLNIRVYHVPEGGSETLIRRINFVYDLRPESTPLTALTIFDAQDNQNLPPTTFGYTDQKVGRSWYQNTCGETHGSCGFGPIEVYESRPFLTTVDNNQGGQLKYEYQAEPFSDHNLFQIIKRRHITDTVGGVNGTYNYSFVGPNFVPTRKIEHEGQDPWYNMLNYGRFFGFGRAVVTDPEDNLTKHYYNNDYNNDPDWQGPTWLNGYETETWFYGPTGQDLYSASLSDWALHYNGSWPPKTRFVYKSAEYEYRCDGKSTDGTNSQNHLAGCVRQRMNYQYEKDNTGNLVKQEEYDRNDQRYRYTDYTYAPNNGHNLISLPSSQTLRAHDGTKVAETRFYYDGQGLGAAATEGNLTRQEVWAGASNYVYTDYGQHDAYGNAGSTTTYSYYTGGGTARTTTTVYDDQGLLPLTVTNPLSQVIETTYDYRFQIPKTETDPNGKVTSYTPDDFGRLIAVTLPGSSGPTFKAQYHNYDGSQPYHEVTQQCLQNCASSSDYVSTYVYYDGLGRKLQARTQGDGAQYIVSDVKYDALGRVVQTAVPYAQSGSAYTTPGWSAFTLTGYDPLGRTISVQQPDGAETVTSYDLYETTVVDPNDHVRVSEQDEFGRLVKVKEFSGTLGSPVLYGTTIYEYDEQDNLIEVTDAANNPTTITYDPLSRKTSMDDPDMGQWYYKYDAAGNLTTQVDATTRATHLYYDELDRLRGKTYNPSVSNPVGYTRPTDPGSGNYTIEYQYDQTGSTHGAGVGRRTHMIDLAGTVDWSYDARGRVLTETYSYYTAAQDNNRLKTVKVGSSLLDLTYHYDDVGNITGLDDNSTSAGGETLTFNYDHLDRLTSANTNGSVLPQFNETYAYNNIGNLITRNGQSYSYPGSGQPRPHAVTAVGSDSYGYDENGNMSTRTEDGITYTQDWTYENKLERVTWVDNGQAYTTTFVYDGDDNRLLKIEETPSGEGTAEITTVYIGQIYEEQFATGSQAQAGVDGGTTGELLVGAESGERRAGSGKRRAESGKRGAWSGERGAGRSGCCW